MLVCVQDALAPIVAGEFDGVPVPVIVIPLPVTVMPLDQVQEPAGIWTVSPFAALLTAVFTSFRLHDAAVCVAACVVAPKSAIKNRANQTTPVAMMFIDDLLNETKDSLSRTTLNEACPAPPKDHRVSDRFRFLREVNVGKRRANIV
jgi:hypothetical protein